MIDCSNMTAAQLMAAAEEHIETEHELSGLLCRAADLAQDLNPALALLFRVLAEEPSEVAAYRANDVAELAIGLRQDLIESRLVNAVSAALQQFEE